MSKKYEKYAIEDFITDEDFIQWAKYPTEASDNFWHSFIKNEPKQASIVENARLAVQQLAIISKQNAPQDEIPRIWEGIEEDMMGQKKTVYFNLNWKQWAVAASLLLVCGLGIWGKVKSTLSNKTDYAELISKTTQPLKEVINTATADSNITLPDGSKVQLKPNSRLSFNEAFEGKLREVYLEGEAFFDVEKDPKKPFMVYANGMVTKVLGTRFSIKAFEHDEEVIVNVKTGKVSVYAQNALQKSQDPETKGIVLTPNQMVVYGKKDESLTRSLIEKPVVIVPDETLKKMVFEEAPVSTILKAIEKAYGVEIIFDEESLKKCALTTKLKNETLFEKLSIVCESIGATYKVVDAQVVIEGADCQ